MDLYNLLNWAKTLFVAMCGWPSGAAWSVQSADGPRGSSCTDPHQSAG